MDTHKEDLARFGLFGIRVDLQDLNGAQAKIDELLALDRGADASATVSLSPLRASRPR